MKRISTLIALLGVIAFTTGCADPDKPKAKPDVKAPYYISSGSVLITKLDYELNNGVYKIHPQKAQVLRIFQGNSKSDPLEIKILADNIPNQFRLGCLIYDRTVYSVIGTEDGLVDLYNNGEMGMIISGLVKLCTIDSNRNSSIMTYWEVNNNGDYSYIGSRNLLSKVSSKVTTKEQLIEQLNNLVKQ